MLETNRLRLHIICSPSFRQIRTGIPESSTEDILRALDSHIALRPLAPPLERSRNETPPESHSLDSTLAGGSQFNSKYMTEIRNSRWSVDTTRATSSSSFEKSPSIRRLLYRMIVLKIKECVPYAGTQANHMPLSISAVNASGEAEEPVYLHLSIVGEHTPESTGRACLYCQRRRNFSQQTSKHPTLVTSVLQSSLQ